MDFDPNTGVLNGTPTGEDVGNYKLNISINDGNQGFNWTEFTLTVVDINDPPIITTEPSTQISQGDQYYVHFIAIDEDDINTYEWTITTDASFLELETQSGILSGTPSNDDVGIYFVNITAEDLRGEMDWLNFSLEVIDVNDPPYWSSTPYDSQLDQGKDYTFTVVARDVDVGDLVSYSISSQPSSDIIIDERSGEITWTGSLEGLTPNPDYVLICSYYSYRWGRTNNPLVFLNGYSKPKTNINNY